MKRIYPVETISDANWHVMPTVNKPGSRDLVIWERTGTEQLDIGVSDDGGNTWSETFRTQPGVPFCIPGLLKSGLRVRVKRVSSNTVYAQQVVDFG